MGIGSSLSGLAKGANKIILKNRKSSKAGKSNNIDNGQTDNRVHIVNNPQTDSKSPTNIDQMAVFLYLLESFKSSNMKDDPTNEEDIAQQKLNNAAGGIYLAETNDILREKMDSGEIDNTEEDKEQYQKNIGKISLVKTGALLLTGNFLGAATIVVSELFGNAKEKDGEIYSNIKGKDQQIFTNKDVSNLGERALIRFSELKRDTENYIRQDKGVSQNIPASKRLEFLQNERLTKSNHLKLLTEIARKPIDTINGKTKQGANISQDRILELLSRPNPGMWNSNLVPPSRSERIKR